MVAKTDIKFYVHTNNNAPQLQNAYGSMINVLDACLVDGIQIGTISSLTASGKTITATFSSAHNLMQYQVIKIAGAAQTEFNGEHRILTVPDANSITFQLALAPSVTTATGTITCSLPSLGWEKPFSSTNETGGGKAAYRSLNLLLPSRPFLRVVDELDPAYTATYAKYAKVGIVEDMTDIDTMLGVQAPYDKANPNKNWVGTGSGATVVNGWARWYYSRAAGASTNTIDTSNPSAGDRPWILVGNSDSFYIVPSFTSTTTMGAVYGFGSFKSFLNADESNIFLSAFFGANSANSAGIATTVLGVASSGISTLLLQRSYSQTAQYAAASIATLNVSSTIYSGTQNYIGAFNLTNVAPLAPVFINETVLRGEIPNLYYLLQQRPYNNLEIFEKNGLLYLAKNIANVASSEGQIALKVGDL